MASEELDEILEQVAAKEAEAEAAAAEYDGHPRWRTTLYCMWAAQMLAIIGFSFVMPFIPFYIRELGVTNERLLPIWAGMMVTGSGIAMGIVAPLWGWVADHYGRKPMVQRAMFGGAVILALMGVVKNARQLLALRVMQGALTGTVSASVALVSSVVPRAQMGYSLGMMQMAVFCGSSIGPYLGGVAAQNLGYRRPFFVTGALLLVAGLLVLVGVRERFVRPARPAPQEGSAARPLGRALPPGVLIVLLMFSLLNLSGSFVGPIFPLFVEHVSGTQGEAAEQTGLILAISGATAALAAIAIGRVSDRVGYKRILVLSTVLAGLMCFPQAAAHSVAQLLLMRALLGLFAGGMLPAMNSVLATAVPRENLGRAYGLATTASAVGWAVGPALGGWAASAFGLRVPFVIMGCLHLALALAQQISL
jgi:DHA1 family multidrug resistance protein-like MFS transporter